MITDEIKNHVLAKDIPYSLGILNAHSKYTSKPWTGDPDILRAMFVGSLIKGRLFLELLGVCVNKNKELKRKERYLEDDIRIEDLGGTTVDLETLQTQEKEILAKFLISTNKHEAHLASPENDDLEHIKPAILLINQLLRKHLSF
jgi:hypothetical protein